jgi:hypothetical protein
MLLAAAGVAAWILASFLAFFDHSDGAAAAFVGAGLVLLLVASYFDRIEEAGPGGVKVRPKVKPVAPDGEDEALTPTPDEEVLEPPEGTLPPPETGAMLQDGVEVFENLGDVPTPTVAALFRAVEELTQPVGARFQRARRKPGRGNNPWLFEFEYPDGTVKAWRVAWGGRGKRSATVGRHKD